VDASHSGNKTKKESGGQSISKFEGKRETLTGRQNGRENENVEGSNGQTWAKGKTSSDRWICTSTRLAVNRREINGIDKKVKKHLLRVTGKQDAVNIMTDKEKPRPDEGMNSNSGKEPSKPRAKREIQKQLMIMDVTGGVREKVVEGL